MVRGTRRRVRSWMMALAVVGTIMAPGLAASPAQALGQRVLLRVLVVSNGDPSTDALATEMDREGIPYTKVPLTDPTRPQITADFLADSATGTAQYQAIILPNQAGGGLGTNEMDALAAYEATYGVRQVNGYDYPSATMGLNSPTYSGALDGAAATVTDPGLAAPFAYLRGSFPIEDVDPSVLETYGYLSAPLDPMPAGQTFTPMITASKDGASGVLAGVYVANGREQLVLPAAFNSSMQWFNVVAPGILSWATRGIHLGYQRNYFALHLDDVLLPDSRWNISGNCTPGDDCVDQTIATPDIRMTSSDVTRLTAWQDSQNFRFDLAFNGAGSEAAKAENGGVDDLTTALLANRAQFQWINHTWSHPYLGCIQIAPTTVGSTWHCATAADEQPRTDPEIAQQESGGTYWAAPSALNDQIQQNITWAQSNDLTNFNADELVTGEHSGLRSLPHQPLDNPFLADALSARGVRYTASDGSREPNPRTLGSGETITLPRHPMNIYYNTATYQEQIDEYNWYYTTAANGGSGICENNSASTCITPLPAATAAEAKQSFDGYLQPLEVRNALRYVLTNDPRPFYAHQSNLAEDGLIYPVAQGVLDFYSSAYNTSTTPLRQPSMAEASQALSRLDSWKTASAGVNAHVDADGVHLPASNVDTPLTMPPGSTGASLESYGGSLSGWVAGSAVAVPPTAGGGYAVSQPATVPDAPAIGTASAGNASATVQWTAPASNGGSPVTGYVIRAFAGASTTASVTETAPADAISTVVRGLVNGTSYRFAVAAVNAPGTGAFSALSNAVIPRLALAPVPMNVVALPGNASATVRWSPPSDVSGVTGYRVRAYVGASTTVARHADVGATIYSGSLTNLTNGTGYTFDVVSLYGTSIGPASQRSSAVTPDESATAPGAPTVTGVVPGNASATVSWQEPEETSGATVTGYRIRAYASTSTTVQRSMTVAASARSASVTGLVNGSAYRFDVRVLLATGAGPVSALSAAVVPMGTVPGPPVIGTASSGAAGGAVTATARWSVPTTNGGAAITGYRVNALRLDAAGDVLDTTTSPLLSSSVRSYAMSLPTVGQYVFTVVAVNSVGDSTPSARSNVVSGQ